MSLAPQIVTLDSDIKLGFVYEATDYPFVLARKKDSASAWFMARIPLLNPIFTDDTPGAAHIPPSTEVLIEQDSFHAGMGQEFYDNVNRIYNSPGVDTRRKGSAVLGPKLSASTIDITPTMPTFTNAGFETGDTTGWTWLDEASTNFKRTGSYSGKETVAAAAGIETFYQDLSGYAGVKGIGVTISAYIHSIGGISASIGVDDGVTSVVYSAANTSASFTESTITVTVSPDATRLRVYGRTVEFGAGAVAYFDDFTIALQATGDTGTVIKQLQWDDKLWAAYGKTLLCYAHNDDEWRPAYTFAADITWIAEWLGYMIVCLGTGLEYWYFNGFTWTESTKSINAEFMATVGATAWCNDSAYQVKSAADPTNSGSWSAATSVGGSTQDITTLIPHPDTVFVGQTNALYQIPSAGANVSLLPILTQASDSNTCANTIDWDGKLYVPTGSGTLIEYDYESAVYTIITPSWDAPGQSAFTGRILTMAGDEVYLYVGIDNGTSVEILAGHWETIDGTTDWWWHHVTTITGLADASANLRSMLISSVGASKRMWLGFNNPTDGIKSLAHPRWYGDVSDDSEYRFDTNGGKLVTSWLESEYPHIMKTFFALSVRTRDCDADHAITVEYQTEEDEAADTWYTLGTIDAEPYETLYYISGVTTRKIRLRFSLATDNDTETPQLKGYSLRARARPFDLEENRIQLKESGSFRVYGGADTSWVHEEYGDIDKAWYNMVVLTEGLSASDSKTITPTFQVDNDKILLRLFLMTAMM